MSQASEAQHLFPPGTSTGEIYGRFLSAARALRPMNVEDKKTCVHFARRSAFAGVHPRKDAILVTLKTAAPLVSARVRKLEQASRSRFHNDLVLTDPDEVDGELLGWVRDAYDLAG
jgi:hypothetical protein